MAVQLKDEIDIIIKQANSFIDYKNKNKPYEQFVHEFLTFADRSNLKQDFKHLKAWLMSIQNANPDEFLEEILNFEGLMKVINDQTKDHGGINREQYDWAQKYFQEAQNDLRPQSYHS
jgi:hypothetical protein